jgi:hypothetical protein
MLFCFYKPHAIGDENTITSRERVFMQRSDLGDVSKRLLFEKIKLSGNLIKRYFIQ